MKITTSICQTGYIRQGISSKQYFVLNTYYSPKLHVFIVVLFKAVVSVSASQYKITKTDFDCRLDFGQI